MVKLEDVVQGAYKTLAKQWVDSLKTQDQPVQSST